jgi:hypothetical protein
MGGFHLEGGGSGFPEMLTSFRAACELVQSVDLLTFILQVQHPERFRGCPQSVHANVVMEPQIVVLPFPSTYIPFIVPFSALVPWLQLLAEPLTKL